MRVVLSGDKRDAATPGIDDYGKLIPRDGHVIPAGKVRITLDGVPQAGLPVTLFDAATGKPIGAVNTAIGAPDPKQVRGSANFNPNANSGRDPRCRDQGWRWARRRSRSPASRSA